MNEEGRILLKSLEEEIWRLVRLHNDLKQKYADQKYKLEKKELEITVLQEKFKKLETDYTNLKAGTAISLRGSDVKATKQQLSKLVREVDKCIALLNE